MLIVMAATKLDVGRAQTLDPRLALRETQSPRLALEALRLYMDRT